MAKYVIKNATIVNEGESKKGSVFIEDAIINKIKYDPLFEKELDGFHIIDAEGKLLIPGAIDDQVHFRDPGLTHKGDIQTESRAAVAGGITSYLEMPNTKPQAVTNEILEEKFTRAAQVSAANYSFFLGATNDNIDELLKVDPKNVCGIKIFMGSSTGNMLVDNANTLTKIFSKSPVLIATHCEDEATINKNKAIYLEKYGKDADVKYHPLIRSEEACYLSSSFAVSLAKKYNTRLHILHLSTAKETQLFDAKPLSKEKKITSEACVHHLYFSDEDYLTKGTHIKWNPAVKTKNDRAGLLNALLEDRIDVIATDHAPHTIEEKQGGAFDAMSGGPMVQHSINLMVEMVKEGKITIEKVVDKMCHNPALLFDIEKRGYIREGYFADLVLIDPNKTWKVTKDTLLYKCGWSPLEGKEFTNKIEKTFVNGNLVYTDGKVNPQFTGSRLTFNRETE